MLKANVQKGIKLAMEDNDATDLSRDQKFLIFCNVCDKLLKEGRISKIQHERWTNAF